MSAETLYEYIVDALRDYAEVFNIDLKGDDNALRIVTRLVGWEDLAERSSQKSLSQWRMTVRPGGGADEIALSIPGQNGEVINFTENTEHYPSALSKVLYEGLDDWVRDLVKAALPEKVRHAVRVHFNLLESRWEIEWGRGEMIFRPHEVKSGQKPWRDLREFSNAVAAEVTAPTRQDGWRAEVLRPNLLAAGRPGTRSVAVAAAKILVAADECGRYSHLPTIAELLAKIVVSCPSETLEAQWDLAALTRTAAEGGYQEVEAINKNIALRLNELAIVAECHADPEAESDLASLAEEWLSALLRARLVHLAGDGRFYRYNERGLKGADKLTPSWLYQERDQNGHALVSTRRNLLPGSWLALDDADL